MATWPRESWEQLPNKSLGKWGKEQLWRERESVHRLFGLESLHPSAPSPALARAPWSDPAPAVCHETGAQVSDSGCCVGSVQADGVRCPQRLFSCRGPQVRVCFGITGSLFGSPQTLRRTADPVYWPPFMDEETETWGVGWGLDEGH